jgi:hypothetical protein
MAKLANRVRFTTATTGTGTITAGAAVAGFRDPAGDSNLADGDSVAYFIEDGTAWEHGTGVLASTKTTMTRVLRESSTGALLNLSGSAEVFLEPGRIDYVDIDGPVAIGDYGTIGTVYFAPGDPANEGPSSTQAPLILNEFISGDLTGTQPGIFYANVGLKHTGAGAPNHAGAAFEQTINSDSTGDFGTVYGLNSYFVNLGTGDVANLVGGSIALDNVGFGSAVAQLTGASTGANVYDWGGGAPGTVGVLIGQKVRISTDANATITTSTGLAVQVEYDPGGTYTNVYGVTIDDVSASGASGANWNIWSKGASSKNVFEGTLEIGHATDTTLSRASAGVLAVEGNNILTTATGQPLDADLTAIAALTTDAAGRSGLTLTDPGADRITFWDDSASSMAYLTLNGLAITGTVLSSVLQGHIFGLTMSNAADTANDITVAAGEATSESGTDLIVLAAPITKQLDAAWAVGTNAGGINTGAEANSTWYEVHLIKRPDTGVVDVMFTTTANRATLPTSYTLQRRIGWIRNDGAGAILQFTQVDDHFTLTTQINDQSITATATAAAVTVTVPPSCIGRFRISSDSNTDNAVNQVTVFSEIVEGNVTPSDATGIASIGVHDIAGSQASHMELRVSSTSTIEHDSNHTTNVIDISTFGWIDTRRRLSAT